MNSNSIAMWETLQNNSDWDCFKTPTLQEILVTRNLLQVDSCAFSEVTRSCQLFGCARNRLQFHTALQKLKIISLDAGLRMDGIPALDLWDLVFDVFHSSPSQLNNTKDQVRGNSSRNTTSNKHTQKSNQSSNPAQKF